jgi:hypothetical protein
MELRYLSPSLNYSIWWDRSALLDTGKMLHNCIGFMCWMMGCLLDTCMYIYIYVCMDHYHHRHHIRIYICIIIYNNSNQSEIGDFGIEFSGVLVSLVSLYPFQFITPPWFALIDVGAVFVATTSCRVKMRGQQQHAPRQCSARGVLVVVFMAIWAFMCILLPYWFDACAISIKMLCLWGAYKHTIIIQHESLEI